MMNKFIGFFEYEDESLEHVIIEAKDTHEAVKKLNEYLKNKKSKQIQMGVSPFKSLDIIK